MVHVFAKDTEKIWIDWHFSYALTLELNLNQQHQSSLFTAIFLWLSISASLIGPTNVMLT